MKPLINGMLSQFSSPHLCSSPSSLLTQPPNLPACLPAAPGSFHMTTTAGGSFTLVTAAANFSAADAACRQQGSHLARYGSLAEQKEVEGYFISTGEACCLQFAAPSALYQHTYCRTVLHSTASFCSLPIRQDLV